jgi:hypothetical protein
MNLKNAGFLALVETVMLTFLLIAGFIFDVLNVLRGSRNSGRSHRGRLAFGNGL